jgi:hypothetical protein
MNNPETLATLGTQNTGQINIRKKSKGQSRMDHPETLAALGTQNTGQINIGKN